MNRVVEAGVRQWARRRLAELQAGGSEARALDVEELDDMLDALEAEQISDQVLEGQMVVWHDDRKHPLVRLREGGPLRIRYRLSCARCSVYRQGQRPHYTTVYLGPGLHKGAWCYAYSKGGGYLANLRDQEYTCDSCRNQPAPKVVPRKVMEATSIGGIDLPPVYELVRVAGEA